MALFFALAILIEYLIVYFSTFSGLEDRFLIIFSFITISPLFHLVPIGVIVALVSSWTYLTKHVAVVPQRVSSTKKSLETRGRRFSRVRKRRLKALRKFFGRVSRAVKVFPSRIRGISYLQKRLFFARAAVKSTAVVLLVFLVSVLSLYLLVLPGLTHDLATGLYGVNPSFHNFVLKTIEIGQGVAQGLSPIGWLASALNDMLRSAAPGFRSALEGIVASRLDVLSGYLLCQNLAAWTSAIVALMYGEYASRRYRISKPR
jgi:hypothetical protein